jgi:hypothetical protein
VIAVKDVTAPLVVRMGVGVTDGTASPEGVASPFRLLGRRERLRLIAAAAAPKTAPLVSGVITAFELPTGIAWMCRNAETCLTDVVPPLGDALAAPAPLTERDVRSAAPSKGLHSFPTHRDFVIDPP